jgi:23S rRNA-/tRNA-specific pseudouridylate synthase
MTYGSNRKPPGLDRQFVHARLLRLRSPHDDQEHVFTAELPRDLATTIERLRRRGPRTS